MLRIKTWQGTVRGSGCSGRPFARRFFPELESHLTGCAGYLVLGRALEPPARRGGRAKDTWMGELGKVSEGSGAVWGGIQIPSMYARAVL